LESPALAEDDDIEVLGTDGLMKDMGAGKFVVVKKLREYEALGVLQAKRKLEEDSDLTEPAGKRVCATTYKEHDCQKPVQGMFVAHFFTFIL
jgi:hypothetical protein